MHNPKVRRVLFAASDDAHDERAIEFARSLQAEFGVEVLCTFSCEDFLAAGVDAREVDATKSAERLIDGVDLLVAHLPEFDDVVLSGASFPRVVQSIELACAALMRAAAKHFAEVAVVSDPDDHDDLLQELRDNDGATLYETRIRNAHGVFQACSDYDYDIAEWLGAKLGIGGE